jgi:hypothetical protein
MTYLLLCHNVIACRPDIRYKRIFRQIPISEVDLTGFFLTSLRRTCEGAAPKPAAPAELGPCVAGLKPWHPHCRKRPSGRRA